MLYREVIAVCSQIHTKHINTLWVERAVRRPYDSPGDLCTLDGSVQREVRVFASVISSLTSQGSRGVQHMLLLRPCATKIGATCVIYCTLAPEASQYSEPRGPFVLFRYF